MGFWSRAETELTINIASEQPHVLSVTTNWSYYVSRLVACDGFTLLGEHNPTAGGREITGTVDISDFAYVRIRDTFGSDKLIAAFEREKARLPQMTSGPIPYRADSFERETLIHAEQLDRYWMRVDTDMGTWLRWMDDNPYAVCVEEHLYAGAASTDGLTDRRRLYMVPRELLRIRRARPQISDAQREALRERALSWSR